MKYLNEVEIKQVSGSYCVGSDCTHVDGWDKVVWWCCDSCKQNDSPGDNYAVFSASDDVNSIATCPAGEQVNITFVYDRQ